MVRPTSPSPSGRRMLPLPAPGATTKIQCGRLELVLERGRGGFLLLAHDGTRGRRWHLGLPGGGALAVRPSLPEHRVVVDLLDPLALAPGGRLHGYLLVPLPWTVCWRAGDGGEHDLLVLLPHDYAAEAGEGDGAGDAIFRVASGFHTRAATPWDPDRLLVPVVFLNGSGESVRPDEVPLVLDGQDLRALRGRWIARPRRVAADGSARTRSWVRTTVPEAVS